MSGVGVNPSDYNWSVLNRFVVRLVSPVPYFLSFAVIRSMLILELSRDLGQSFVPNHPLQNRSVLGWRPMRAHPPPVRRGRSPRWRRWAADLSFQRSVGALCASVDDVGVVREITRSGGDQMEMR